MQSHMWVKIHPYANDNTLQNYQLYLIICKQYILFIPCFLKLHFCLKWNPYFNTISPFSYLG